MVENKNNHTTSTKCQYHALRSNEIKWYEELNSVFILFAVIIKNIDPTITWIPWNPVAKKNVDPYDESEKVNLAL